MRTMPVLPVQVIAAVLHGADLSRKAELQADANRAAGRLVTYPVEQPKQRAASRWMPYDEALTLWRVTWELLEALGERVV